ncbi:MAG TPA: DUF499 domain-containing protein [Ktedonosporobacter sp.]|jgi:hypothetical protein|nr:DUF499 domain-containing protein [Ktedonosporobacter sp.]
MSLKPWYKLIDPRQDLRDYKPLDAAEFAVHLDMVRDERAPDDYQVPSLFFERTYLTKNLTQLACEVIGRLSGKVHGTNAVFNLTTQFGGGKTHALTLLYHLATHGAKADRWFGVDRLLKTAGLATIPKAATAVFVGTEFDSLSGRGGNDGTPIRKTPWGELAYQLRGEEGLNLVAEHERQLIAPAGDVIRQLFPPGKPCLILMDELINYMSRNRQLGLADQLYNFVQSLSEAVRGQEQVVLVISLPKAATEMTDADHDDYQRFTKLLGRLSKPIAIASETEVSEIIRRRLFEWDRAAIGPDGTMTLSAEQKEVCALYARWVMQHRYSLSPQFPFEQAQQEFESSYPFHPTVISLFQRKWRTLPQFQQTRGILKLLAQWVAEAFTDSYKNAQQDLLIGLGTAPVDNVSFRRTVVDEQLDEKRLDAVITTDIGGRPDSHADYLDRQAEGEVKKRRLHRKIATAIFFESNGGQMDGSATLPEIRLAVGEPGIDLGEIEHALERLIDTCYYLQVQGQKYSFDVLPNLNKLLADRRASISLLAIEERVHEEVVTIFARGPVSGLDRKYFPTGSTDIPNRPLVTLVVVAPEQPYQDPEVQKQIKILTNQYGESYRTFKNALIWCVADKHNVATLYAEARKLLALQAIENDEHMNLSETQQKLLQDARKRAERDMREAIWRSYHHLILLNKNNELRSVDLGLVHSSAANTLTELILRELRQTSEIVESISVNYLLRHWPAQTEWSTRGIREIVFASPRFPRLLNPDSLRATIAQGVTNGQIAYVGKNGATYEPMRYKAETGPGDIEFSDEMFIITGETAEQYLTAQARGDLVEVAIATEDEANGKAALFREEVGLYVGPTSDPFTGSNSSHQPADSATQSPALESMADETVSRLAWSGEIPPLRWGNFYTRILTKFIPDGGVKLRVQMEIAPEKGISQQKIDEARIALRELGLNEALILE